jgi:Amt family ammonium transporter
VQDWVKMTSGFPGIGAQLLIQAKAVGITIVWTAVVALIAFKIADLIVGLRVSEEQEREGLDISSHGESAYDY